MTSSNYAHVTDELLSAYIDGAVSTQERALVEAAMAADPHVAWRLETMRYTVSLLQQLPEVPLPRSFTFSVLPDPEIAAAVPMAAAVAAPRPTLPAASPRRGFWDAWRDFWQSGNLVLRNAGAVALVAFLLLVAGDELLQPALAPAGAPAVVSGSQEAAEQAAASEAQPMETQPTDVQPGPIAAEDAAPRLATEAEAPAEADTVAEAPAEAAPAEAAREAPVESAAEPDIAGQGAPTAFSQEPAGDAAALRAPAQAEGADVASAPPFDPSVPMPGSEAGGFGGGGAMADMAPPSIQAIPGQGGGGQGPAAAQPGPFAAGAAPAAQEEAAAASPAEAPVAASAGEPAQAEAEAAGPETEAAAPAQEQAGAAAADAEPAVEPATAPTAAAPAAKTPAEVALAAPEAAPAEPAAASPQSAPLYIYLEIALGAAAVLLLLFWLFSRSRPAR